MADKKISELTAITGSNTAATDVFVVVDTSTGQTKKITREELNNAIEQDVLSSIDIDTINGDFSVNGNINLGDNDKAIFGAGSDLQIFHQSSNGNSIIKEQGGGILSLQTNGSEISFYDTANLANMARFITGGGVQLYHNGSTKFSTNASGINVTGTVTADGLTVDGSSAGRVTLGTFTNTTNAAGTEAAIALRNQATGNADVSLVASRIGANFGSDFYIETSDSADGTNRKRFNIAEDGDISFYEDTGTTAKLFWDASEERLGLGTTSPNDRVQVNGELSVTANDTAYADEYFAKLKSEYGAIALALETRAGDVIQASNFGQELTFLTGPNSTGTVERLRITSAGLVGIGIASPLGQLHINTETAEATKVYVDGEANQPKSIEIRHYDTSEGSGAGRNLFYLKTPASGRLDIGNFSDGSSETQLMTFLESGNVGIGTSSPARTLHVHASQPYLHMTNPVTGSTTTDGLSILVGQTNGEALIIQRENQPIQIYTNGSERMRIDNSGEIYIDGTGRASSNNGAYTALRNGDSDNIETYRIGTGTRSHHNFYNGSFGNRAFVGAIKTSGSSTSYNTTSDHRLKENVTGITDGIERVKQLNPSRFNFIADADTTVDGFIAHEAQTVVPEAITGEKDAMRDEEYEVTPAVYEDVVIPAVLDDDGNEIEAERTEQQLVTEAVMGTRSVPDYQGIDQAKLVPLLTAALQEAITKIEDLEARVATLEGN